METREMRDGKYPELLLAIARSPLPTVARDLGLAIWRDAVQIANGPKVADIRKRTETVESALAVFRAVIGIASKGPV